MLYTGYVGLAVPFAFAMGALLSKKLGNQWVRTVRRWTLIPWMFLSAGIIDGQQMGLYGIGVGWLLGLGPGGKCQFSALANRHGVSPQHHHSRAPRHLEKMEFGPDRLHLFSRDSGHVYHPQRDYSKRPQFCPKQCRDLFPGFPGRQHRWFYPVVADTLAPVTGRKRN